MRNGANDRYSDSPRLQKPPPTPRAPPGPSHVSFVNSPAFPILSYCGSSILMTVLNKYVLSPSFNLNFFLLIVQVRPALSYRKWLRVYSRRRANPSWGIEYSMHSSNLNVQSFKCHHIPGFQLGRSEEMYVQMLRVPHIAPFPKPGPTVDTHRVPRLPPPRRYDLHGHQSHSIPLHPGLHHLQELDHHHHRVRRGAMVWRLGDAHDALQLRPHRPELRRCGMG